MYHKAPVASIRIPRNHSDPFRALTTRDFHAQGTRGVLPYTYTWAI